MINIKFLLLLSFVAMSIVYYIFLPLQSILEIIKDEYILMFSILASLCGYVFLKIKLNKLEIFELIPNTQYVVFKNSILFFLVFQIFDYFYEDGFIGMISQWFLYFLFGILAHIITLSLNLFKNYKFYELK